MATPHSKELIERIITELRTINVSTGDSVNLLSVARFSRTEGPPKDLPAGRIKIFDERRSTGEVEEVGAAAKVLTVLCDFWYARDVAKERKTDEIDEALGADVEAVANALDWDNTFRAKLLFERWAPFHSIDPDVADFGIRCELLASWQQDKSDGTIIL